MNRKKDTTEFMISRRQFVLGLTSIGIAPVGLLSYQNANSADLISNENLILAVIGMLQPVTAQGVHEFLTAIISEAKAQNCLIGFDKQNLDFSSIEAIVSTFSKSNMNYVVEVGSASDKEESLVYSLTLAGNNVLSHSMRGLRDQVRLFLLKGPRHEVSRGNNISSQRGGCNSLGGDSPSLLKKHILEQAKPPKAGKLLSTAHYVDVKASALYLPRFYHDAFLSFNSRDLIGRAGGLDPQGKITGEGIALCIGISWQMLYWISRNVDLKRDQSSSQVTKKGQLNSDYSSKHYNRFYLSNKNSNKLIGPNHPQINIASKSRLIESPKIFLKVIQRYILDFLLTNDSAGAISEADFQAHSAVHSYIAGKGPQTNAESHKGRAYIVKMDIKDFFGSINRDRIRRLYIRRGFAPETAILLAKLCTILDPSIKNEKGISQSRLPQGAPTSPYLSNLVLYDLDVELSYICSKETMGATYTRYADDITISGDSRDIVTTAFLIARKILLDTYRFQVNYKKCCFISHARQQRVTGVVINEKALPPRVYRRRLRALFHKAGLDPGAYKNKVQVMRGHLNYLKSFGDYSKKEIVKYQQVLARVQAVK